MPAQLKRQLGFWDSIAINIGIVIGVGIFRVPADIARYLDQPTWILLAWILGGLISLLGVLCYAELSSCFPQTGGTYVFLREAYGKSTAFAFGWMEFTVQRAGSMAGVAYVLAAYMKHFLPYAPGTEKWIAIVAIFIFTAVNLLGLRYGASIQNVLSTLKVVTLFTIIGLVFFAGQDRIVTPSVIQLSWRDNAMGLAPALIPVLWSYGGWHESTFMSGEFRDTNRALPRSLIFCILMIAALYIATNAAYLAAMSIDEIRESRSIAADIFRAFFGPTGGLLISAAVLISASGALNSTIMTGARIPFAVAQDSLRLSWLGNIHALWETPYAAYLVNAAWASMLVLWGNFEDLLFFTGFAKWFFFALAGWSVFRLRKKIRHAEAFRMWGYPWVPALFTLVSVILFFTTISFAPKAALLGFVFLIASVPVYLFLHPKDKGAAL